MKSIYIVLFLLSTFSSFSQIQKIDSIPKEGIVLNKGWKFHAGDNAEWAKPDFESSKWANVQLSDYNSYLPQFKTKNIGWFRLELLIDSAVKKKQLAIQLSQLGASEIYLNGQLFQRLGSIDTPLKFQSFNPADKPLLLPFIVHDSIVIALRFASKVPSRVWLFTDGDRLPLTIKINSWSNALDKYQTSKEEARTLAIPSYFAVTLALLFILFYVFFPKEKLNLLFGALMLFAATRILLAFKLSQGSLSMNGFGSTSYLLSLNDVIEGILILSIISIAVFNKITVFVWFIFSIFVIDSLRILFFGNSFPAFVFTAHAVATITFFYLSVSAFRKRNYIIGIVAFNSFILNLYFFKPALFGNLDFLVALILTANFIMITIYVAMNFARKSKNLEVQLVEIGNLSKDNLKKERKNNKY